MNHLKLKIIESCPKILRLTVLSLIAVFGSSPASFGDTLSHAFSISKNKGENLVVYDVALKDDCSFSSHDPFQVHWLIPHRPPDGLSRRIDLSGTELLYYGLRMGSFSPNQIEGEIEALANQEKIIKLIFKTKKSASHCLVTVSGSRQDSDGASDYSRNEAQGLSLIKLKKLRNTFTQELNFNERKSESDAATRYFISLQ